jgi:hypothetical protein
MEAIAEFLVEHGSAEMPIAAVRGENLLSSIEWLPTKFDLKDRQILSAHADIGGESLATALAEGARIVLTGAYDTAAPFLAASVSRGFCDWQDFQLLGNIAAASQFERIEVNIESDGAIELAHEAKSQLARVKALAFTEHADVSCDYSRISLTRNERNSLQIANIFAKPATSTWKVRETYDAGYRASALIGMPSQRVAEIQEFCSSSVDADKLSIEKFTPEDALESQLIRLQCEASTARECQQFIELLQSMLRQSVLGEFAEPLPSIVHLTETMEKLIPIDRLTLSVDTRPASEWL